MYRPSIQTTGWAASLLGLSVFVFYFFYYPYHLCYQEQFQLFLNTPDYFFERIMKPGGFSEYIAGFFIQFFYYRWASALIMAVLIGLTAYLTTLIAYGFGLRKAFECLTCIPALLYWSLLCDENYLLGGLIAVILALLAVYIYQRIVSCKSRFFYLLMLLPVWYWFTGGLFIVFGVVAILWEFLKKENTSAWKWLSLASVCMMTVLLPFCAKFLLVQYPIERLFRGVDFYRYTQYPVSSILVVALSLIIVPVLFVWLPDFEKRKGLGWVLLQLFVLVIGGVYLIKGVVDWDKEEIMAYDFHVRRQQWDEVVRMADKKAPSTSLSVACLNLALCKNGLLGDRMFHYYQNGSAGLLPNFTRDYTIPFVAGEIYYHLGFINTAQRYAFEAMESLPDYQKSVRAIKRLAETNIINGEYAVARKYLHLLQKTTLYGEWSTLTLASLQHEESIESNSEWATLRSYRTQNDFLFSDPEKPMMLGLLLQQNHHHRMAYEYLLAYCLLTKDLKHFYAYYPLGEEIGYQSIPVHFQEALIYIWGLSNEDPTQNIPYPISEQVKKNVIAYGNTYTSHQNPEPMLKQLYSGTYWYYYHFRKHNKTTYEELYDVYADHPASVSHSMR